LGFAMLESFRVLWYPMDTDAIYETMPAMHKEALC
jgi:hypothetical protein